jgi:hypothetical protein
MLWRYLVLWTEAKAFEKIDPERVAIIIVLLETLIGTGTNDGVIRIGRGGTAGIAREMMEKED